MELEELLLERNSNASTFSRVRSNKKPDVRSGLLTAKRNSSLEDFIEMVNKLVTLTLQEDDLEVEFLPDENQHTLVHPEEKIDKVYITYNVLDRHPNKEIKPTVRETIEESPDNPNARLGTVYGQRFDCMVQFNIMASEYRIANRIMSKFEDMIFSFTGYMKEQGVGNILFKGQQTDAAFDIYRKSFSIRNIKYYVEIEKMVVIFNESIQEVINKIDVKND